MLKSIVEEIAAALVSNEIIKAEEKEAYAYGLELLIPQAILYTVILSVSLITNTFLESFAFVILLLCLRRYTGGFHCKTAKTCLLISFLIYLLSLWGYGYVQYIPNFVCGISSIASAVVVLIFSPVENANRPLDNSEKVRYRKKSMTALSIILLLEIAALIFRCDAILYLSACSLTANAVLILLSQKRGCKYEVSNPEGNSEND